MRNRKTISEMMPQQYCLRWKYHHSNLQNMFSQLLDRGCFCDVTLACEGQTLKAHRVVLCACSTYFDSILTNCSTEKDPIILMRDCKFSDIKCLIEFMYKGEINVEHSNLASLLKTAEDLRIKGLAEVSWRDDDESSSSTAAAALAATTTTNNDELPTSEKRSRKQANASLSSNSTTNNNNNNINNQRTSSSTLGTSTILPSSSSTSSTTTTTNTNLNTDSPHHHNNSSSSSQLNKQHHNLSSSNHQHHQHQPMAILTPKPINDLMAYPATIITAGAATAIGSTSTSPPALSYPPQSLLRESSPQPSLAASQTSAGVQQQQPPVKRKRGRPPLDGEFDNYSRPKMLQINSNITKSIDNCNTKIPYHHIIANENMVSVILDESSQPSGSLTTDIAEINTGGDMAKKNHRGDDSDDLIMPSTSLRVTDGNGDDEASISNRSNGNNNKHRLKDGGGINADDSWNEPQRKSSKCEDGNDDEDGGDDDGDSLRLIPKLERPDTPPDDFNEQFDGPGSPSDPNNGNDYLTPQEQEEWKGVVKMNDYLIKGRRPQFWEEPFTKRVMEAINNKDLEMKKAAALLGVSYGTLYGRYRETYGCLKHPYRHRGTNCDVSGVGVGGSGGVGGNSNWGEDTPPGPFQIIGLLQRGVITLPQAAELISCTSSSAAKGALLYQLSKESNTLEFPEDNNKKQLIKTDDSEEDDLLIEKVETNLPDISVKRLKGILNSNPSPNLSSASSSSSSPSHSSSASSSSSSSSSSTASRHHRIEHSKRKSIT